MIYRSRPETLAIESNFDAWVRRTTRIVDRWIWPVVVLGLLVPWLWFATAAVLLALSGAQFAVIMKGIGRPKQAKHTKPVRRRCERTSA